MAGRRASLPQAARSSRLAGLEALRDLLATQIEAAGEARDVATLARQLVEVMAQIDALGGGEKAKETPLDEFSKRLAAKRKPGAAS